MLLLLNVVVVVVVVVVVECCCHYGSLLRSQQFGTEIKNLFFKVDVVKLSCVAVRFSEFTCKSSRFSST